MIKALYLQSHSLFGYISILAMTFTAVGGSNLRGQEGGDRGASSQNGNTLPMQESWWDPSFHVTLTPSKVEHLPVHQNRIVFINCSNSPPNAKANNLNPSLSSDIQNDHHPPSIPRNNSHNSSSPSTKNSTLPLIPAQRQQTSPYYVAKITSADSQVVIPAGSLETVFLLDENRTDQILLRFLPEEGSVFSVQAVNVGYGVLVVQFYDQWEETGKTYIDDDPLYWNLTKPIYEFHFSVSVVRRVRWVDMTFDCVIAAVATLNAFSVGCDSEWSSVHNHLRKPFTLILALICQLIINPLLGLALAKVFFLTEQQGLGLFLVSCVPGGGAGHLIVSIIGADRSLSISINCANIFLAVGITPMWIFGMGRFLSPTNTNLETIMDFEIWLGASAGAYMMGVFLNHFRSSAAEGFLNWFMKPFLLLFCILFITLGMYINQYMFAIVDYKTSAAAFLLTLISYLVGTSGSVGTKRATDQIRTIATETTMYNCLLVLVMIRFSLSEPDADISSAIPFWVLFFTPMPFLITCILFRCRRTIRKQCEKRRERKFRTFSIVSSLLNVTNVTNLSSSTSPKMNSPVEEIEDAQILIDEKITVL